MKFFYVWTDRQSIIKTDRLTDRPHQLILRSSLPDLRNIFCFFTSILTVFVSIAEVISSSLAYSMFCSYWTHLGPTSLLESLGAEIVRILDLVTHSNNFDFLDKIQNLSEYIFRGDSLSRNHFFTHSLTHWLTHWQCHLLSCPGQLKRRQIPATWLTNKYLRYFAWARHVASCNQDDKKKHFGIPQSSPSTRPINWILCFGGEIDSPHIISSHKEARRD